MEKAWRYARLRLSDSRFLHTEGTVEEARRLAPLFGVDAGRAELAAVLHDIAREYRSQELLQAAREQGIMIRTIDEYCPILLHGRVGALVAARFGVEDEGVLEAIASHVTGRPGWTSLEQVLYLADKAEGNRDYPGVRRVRSLIRSGRLMEALQASLRNAIVYAATHVGFVDPETVVVLNEVSQGLAQAEKL